MTDPKTYLVSEEEARDRFLVLADEHTEPIYRSMYPSRSREQMTNVFTHFMLTAFLWSRDKYEPELQKLREMLAVAEEALTKLSKAEVRHGFIVLRSVTLELQKHVNDALSTIQKIRGRG